MQKSNFVIVPPPRVTPSSTGSLKNNEPPSSPKGLFIGLAILFFIIFLGTLVVVHTLKYDKQTMLSWGIPGLICLGLGIMFSVFASKSKFEELKNND